MLDIRQFEFLEKTGTGQSRRSIYFCADLEYTGPATRFGEAFNFVLRLSRCIRHASWGFGVLERWGFEV